MTNTMKILMAGAAATLGLASAAVAQQSGQPNNAQHQTMTPEQHRQMMSDGTMGEGQMKMIMNDPQKREQMTEMMAGCNRMMQMMGNMSDMNGKPNK